MSEDEKAKMLKLVRFWIFGILILVGAGLTAFFAVVSGGYLSAGQGILMPTLMILLPIVIGAVILYFTYTKYLDRL